MPDKKFLHLCSRGSLILLLVMRSRSQAPDVVLKSLCDSCTITDICGRNPFLPDNQLRDKPESLHDHVLSSFHISDLSPCACNRSVPLRLYLYSNDTEIFFNRFICSSVISETKTWFSM